MFLYDDDENLVCYFWGNFYLSSIQQGIQAAHALGRIVTKYQNLVHTGDDNNHQNNMVQDYLMNHETVYLKNGGDSEALEEIIDNLTRMDCPYPWAPFRESKGALNRATTSVGIILPEHIYDFEMYVKDEDTGKRVKNKRFYALSAVEQYIVQLNRSTRLAI